MSSVVERLAGAAGAGLKGLYSVCSAHPWVLQAAIEQAKDDGTPVLIESTSNQVDQDGGYTGMKPADFVRSVRQLADQLGLPHHQLILGGDHLGPNAWRALGAAQAMQKAETLIDAYVAAGYSKIHLDTSMSCSDDPARLSDRVVAERAARLCAVAEAAADRRGGQRRPFYVIGTEVPVPGGAHEALEEVQATSGAAALETVAVHRAAWDRHGLQSSWDRVIALVVQPGVEFDNTKVSGYQRAKAGELTRVLERLPGMVYEAHSTDYQTPDALAQMVEDGFAILKVGPGLTFALREALYALAGIEAELIEEAQRSKLREIVELVMRARPGHWQAYYGADEGEQRRLRSFSYSDRIRYYWGDPEIEHAVQRLMGNLESTVIPESLLSQYLPAQYAKLRRGAIDARPASLVRSKVREVLACYARACRR